LFEELKKYKDIKGTQKLNDKIKANLEDYKKQTGKRMRYI